MADKGKAPSIDDDEDFCDILYRKMAELSEVLTSLYNEYSKLPEDVFTKDDITTLLSEHAPILKAVYNTEDELYKYAKENCPSFLKIYKEYANAWRLLDHVAQKDFPLIQAFFRTISQNTDGVSEQKLNQLNQELVQFRDTFKRIVDSEEIELTEKDVSVLLEIIDTQIRNLIKLMGKQKVVPISRSAQSAFAQKLKKAIGPKAGPSAVPSLSPRGGPPPPPPPPPPPSAFKPTDPLAALKEAKGKARGRTNMPPATRAKNDELIKQIQERQKAKAKEEPPQEYSETQINDLLRNVLSGNENTKKEVCDYLRNKRHTRSDWNVGVEDPNLLRIFKMLRDFYRTDPPNARKLYKAFRQANCEEGDLPPPNARPLRALRSRRPQQQTQVVQSRNELNEIFQRRRAGLPPRARKPTGAPK